MKKMLIFSVIVLFLNQILLSNNITNSIYIRFRPHTDRITIKSILNSEGFLAYSQLLPDSISLTKKLENNDNFLSYHSNKIDKIIKAEEPLLRTYEVELSENINPFKLCDYLLKKYPEIEIAEPIFKDEILEIPNDPYASNQTMLATIKAFNTWDAFKGDTNVVIGIVDTGVLQEHEDLNNSIAPNWKEIPDNNIDDDGNGFVDDFMGCNLAYPAEGNGGNTFHTVQHGTSVAGIAGATTNNGKGIAGVAYKCRIFPIKASKSTSTSSIDFGYKGILYAAIRGFKVVNCSWGQPKPFSPIDQSIIDYAVARDVVVVAAGGNKKNNLTEVYYPAGYSGVLAVGEVNQMDYVTPTSTINETVRILAPGVGNYVTLNTPNGYEMSKEGGTSFAAPVVAGAVAIVRSYYPELDPLQTIEYVRQLSDDISEKNPSVQYLIPGRLNLSKMLEVNPFSIPGIKPIKIIFSHPDGTPDERFSVGDTVLVKISAKNYLGSAKNLKFVLSNPDIFDSSIEVLSNEQNLPEIHSNSDFTIGPFSFIIKEKNENKAFLRVDILGENDYRDFFLIPFVPTNYITTFENDSIYFSISDKGTLGFYLKGSNKFGVGVGSKSLGNQLFKGGLLVTEDSAKIVTALFGLAPDGSDFNIVKPFAFPQKNISVIDDSLALSIEKIGIQIQQLVYLPPNGHKFFKIFFKVKNITSRPIKNLAIGYYKDWDVGQSAKDNFAYLEPNAIPKTIIPIAAAVQFIQSGDSSVVVGVGVLSNNSSDIPQSAVLSSDYTSAFSRDKQILSINSGVKLQFKGFDDIAVVSGMKFPGEIPPGGEREFSMMIGISSNKEELKQIFLGNLLQGNVGENTQPNYLQLFPIPTQNVLNIEVSNFDIVNSSYQIINIFGQIVKSGKLSTNVLDVSNLEAGVYLFKIISNSRTFWERFVKLN